MIVVIFWLDSAASPTEAGFEEAAEDVVAAGDGCNCYSCCELPLPWA